MDGTSRDKKDAQGRPGVPHPDPSAAQDTAQPGPPTGPDSPQQDPPAPPVDPDTAQAPVPPEVRAQLLDLAARVLGAWDPGSVPVTLRRVRTFAPRRRAASGAAPLWHALETSATFRHAVAVAWSTAHPLEARELTHGDPALGGDVSHDAAGPAVPAPGRASSPGPSGAVGPKTGAAPATRDDGVRGSVVNLAVGAFFLRPEGWHEHLERARQEAHERLVDQRRTAHAERAVSERDKARAELEALRQATAADRAALEEARAEIATLRRTERRLRSDADRARSEARAARAEAAAQTQAAEELAARAAAERREAAVALERAHAARDEARTLTHTGAELANARARLLLETVVDAAVGLRRELGIPPTTLRPGDTVAAAEAAATAQPSAGTTRPGSRGRAGDDPALLDDVLAVPQMHLIVDGYNVSKTGFGSLTLAQQRRRLVDGLVRIASRTGAEVTCCFDGQDLGHLPPASTRGVRVLFSSGEIADHLIRRLVAAEPEGRPVAVVTSDREVADDVQAMGAVAIGSPALVARLARL